MLIYNAEGQILGRLCTEIAQQLLRGERVFVVNVEKAVISGNPRHTIRLYKARRARGGPHHGPFFPRTPDGIFRRAVRGMLPWSKPRGRKAFKNLKVFIGIPAELGKKELKKLERADVSRLKTKYISLGELAVELGAKKRW